MIRALALALVPVAFLALASITQAGGQEGTLLIRVINDLDEDGVRDKGEPGLEDWELSLGCGDALKKLGPTEPDGTTVYPHADGSECVSLRLQFGWFATSPRRIVVPILPGGQAEVVFLARHVGDEVEHFSGWAIVGGLPAPTTAVLDALVDGVSCGDGQATKSFGRIQYQLYVLGASERDGCAAPVDTVLFTIDGVPAGIETFEPGEYRSLDLISGPVPMYFTFWHPDTAVMARIDEVDCGQGYPFAGVAQSVFVKAAASSSGCGEQGKVVNLSVGDVVVAQVLWREGEVFGEDLQYLGDADCDSETNSVDAALILQYSARVLEYDDIDCSEAADVYDYLNLDALDASLVLQRSAGLIQYFP